MASSKSKSSNAAGASSPVVDSGFPCIIDAKVNPDWEKSLPTIDRRGAFPASSNSAGCFGLVRPPHFNGCSVAIHPFTGMIFLPDNLEGNKKWPFIRVFNADRSFAGVIGPHVLQKGYHAPILEQHNSYLSFTVGPCCIDGPRNILYVVISVVHFQNSLQEVLVRIPLHRPDDTVGVGRYADSINVVFSTYNFARIACHQGSGDLYCCLAKAVYVFQAEFMAEVASGRAKMLEKTERWPRNLEVKRGNVISKEGAWDGSSFNFPQTQQIPGTTVASQYEYQLIIDEAPDANGNSRVIMVARGGVGEIRRNASVLCRPVRSRSAISAPAGWFDGGAGVAAGTSPPSLAASLSQHRYFEPPVDITPQQMKQFLVPAVTVGAAAYGPISRGPGVELMRFPDLDEVTCGMLCKEPHLMLAMLPVHPTADAALTAAGQHGGGSAAAGGGASLPLTRDERIALELQQCAALVPESAGQPLGFLDQLIAGTSTTPTSTGMQQAATTATGGPHALGSTSRLSSLGGGGYLPLRPVLIAHTEEWVQIPDENSGDAAAASAGAEADASWRHVGSADHLSIFAIPATESVLSFQAAAIGIKHPLQHVSATERGPGGAAVAITRPLAEADGYPLFTQVTRGSQDVEVPLDVLSSLPPLPAPQVVGSIHKSAIYPMTHTALEQVVFNPRSGDVILLEPGPSAAASTSYDARNKDKNMSGVIAMPVELLLPQRPLVDHQPRAGAASSAGAASGSGSSGAHVTQGMQAEAAARLPQHASPLLPTAAATSAAQPPAPPAAATAGAPAFNQGQRLPVGSAPPSAVNVGSSMSTPSSTSSGASLSTSAASGLRAAFSRSLGLF